MNNYEDKLDIIGIRKLSEFYEFIKFIGVPKFFRQDIFGFTTEQDFAKKHNLVQDTLTDWKRRKGFGEAVKAEFKVWGKDKTGDVISALYRNILKHGDKAEVELWLKYFDDYKDEIIIDSKLDKAKEDLSNILNQNGLKAELTIINRESKEGCIDSI